jgi:hypothetical protein
METIEKNGEDRKRGKARKAGKKRERTEKMYGIPCHLP